MISIWILLAVLVSWFFGYYAGDGELREYCEEAFYNTLNKLIDKLIGIKDDEQKQ